MEQGNEEIIPEIEPQELDTQVPDLEGFMPSDEIRKLLIDLQSF